MTTKTPEDRETIRAFKQAVNMPPHTLERWLATAESKEVGFKGSDGAGDGESVGHQSGRRIVRMLRKKVADYSAADVAHARKVTGYVHRHLAQHPAGDVSASRWRYSLMNWGHDPSKR